MHRTYDERRVSSRIDPEKGGQPLETWWLGPGLRPWSISQPEDATRGNRGANNVLDRQLNLFVDTVRFETGVTGPIVPQPHRNPATTTESVQNA